MEVIQSIYVYEILDKKGIIEYFYRQEAVVSWHTYIHKRGGTIEENIQDTLSSISESSIMYVVNVQGKMAAYFVWHETEKGELVMEGFHVLKEYRNREFLTEFWGIVKNKFNRPFITGICSRNEPAIKSLFKAGFQPINVVENENHVFIILKYDESWQ